MSNMKRYGPNDSTFYELQHNQDKDLLLSDRIQGLYQIVLVHQSPVTERILPITVHCYEFNKYLMKSINIYNCRTRAGFFVVVENRL